MKYLIVCFFLCLISCTGGKREVFEYFNNTQNIKWKYTYFNKRDTSSYKYQEFYENGNIKTEYTNSNGKLNGEKIEYYSSGIIESRVNYIDGKADGIVQVFNEKGELGLFKTYKNDKLNGQYIRYNRTTNIKQTLLFVNDTQLVRIDEGPIIIDSVNYYVSTWFYNDPVKTLFVPIGTLKYKYSNGKKVKEQISCTYFETLSKDTIQYGDFLEIEIISNIGLHEGHSISLFLGEIDENFSFIDSSSVKIYKSDSNILKITLSEKDYASGVNLLTGKLRVYKEGKEITQDNMISEINNIPYIFFKQFHVIDNESNTVLGIPVN